MSGCGWTKSVCSVHENTSGTQCPVTSISPLWRMLQQPKEGQIVFEEKPNGAVNINCNHVLLHSSAPFKDSEVPALASSAIKWDSFAVPGMQPEMVFLADLQCKSEWRLVKELNSILEERELGQVAYINDALTKLKFKGVDKEIKEELREVLVAFFAAKAGSETAALDVMREWPLVMQWRRQRVAFAHPLGANKIDRTKLESMKQQVQEVGPYQPVRSAALVLIAAAEAVLSETEAITL